MKALLFLSSIVNKTIQYTFGQKDVIPRFTLFNVRYTIIRKRHTSFVQKKHAYDNAVLSKRSINGKIDCDLTISNKDVYFYLLSFILPFTIERKINLVKNREEETVLTKVDSPFLEEKEHSETEENKKNVHYMSRDMESYLCNKIKEFEKQKKYLDKSVSLSNLSARFGVNHRYVSYYINTHKEKDFATYINELRISYMVDTLKTNPHYLTYKISYLADKSGFASHSRFTINFKKITGVLPSEFISEIKENIESV